MASNSCYGDVFFGRDAVSYHAAVIATLRNRGNRQNPTPKELRENENSMLRAAYACKVGKHENQIPAEEMARGVEALRREDPSNQDLRPVSRLLGGVQFPQFPLYIETIPDPSQQGFEQVAEQEQPKKSLAIVGSGGDTAKADAGVPDAGGQREASADAGVETLKKPDGSDAGADKPKINPQRKKKPVRETAAKKPPKQNGHEGESKPKRRPREL